MESPRQLRCTSVLLVVVLLLVSSPSFALSASQAAAADPGRIVLPPIAVGTHPIAVAVNPVTNKIYVANNWSADITG